jgi:ubiquinone/menaquinone biosynthesis C-methylase UbiE
VAGYKRYAQGLSGDTVLSGKSAEFLADKSTVVSAYNERYSGRSPWRELGGKYKAKNIVEVCKRAGFAPARILEVGAGEGAVLRELSERGFGQELHALEISKSGIEAIESRELPNLKSATWFDGYTIPFPDDSFDAVILCHVLEHVEFERLLLRELRRVSSRHIVEVPLDYYQGIDAKYQHYLGYGHINVYTPTSIRFLLKSEGFSLEQELLTITHEEVMEFNEFTNQKKERTPANVAEFHQRMSAKAMQFYTAPKEQAEHFANALTVLTSRNEEGLRVFKK